MINRAIRREIRRRAAQHEAQIYAASADPDLESDAYEKWAVMVGPRNGLDHDSVVHLDALTTIPRRALVRPVGALLEDQERDLTRAFHVAFDLED